MGAKNSEKLPQLRVSPGLKGRLEEIAAGSVSPRLSDHMRQALAEYVARHDGGRQKAGCDGVGADGEAVDETEKLMLALA